MAITDPIQHFASRAADAKAQAGLPTELNPLSGSESVLPFPPPDTDETVDDGPALDKYMDETGTFDLGAYMEAPNEAAQPHIEGGLDLSALEPAEGDALTADSLSEDRLTALIEGLDKVINRANAREEGAAPSLEDQLREKYGALTKEDSEEFGDIIAAVRKAVVPEAVMESNEALAKAMARIDALEKQVSTSLESRPAGVSSEDLFKTNLPAVVPHYDRVVASKQFKEVLDGPQGPYDSTPLRNLWDGWHKSGQTDKIAKVVSDFLAKHTNKRQALSQQVVVQGTASATPISDNASTAMDQVSKAQAVFKRLAVDRDFRRSFPPEQLKQLREITAKNVTKLN